MKTVHPIQIHFRKKLKYILVILTVLGGLNKIGAQPFNLDKAIKPLEIKLADDPDNEGAKGMAVNTSIKSGETHYFYVTGHDIFQFLEVFIFPSNESAHLEASVVKDSWKDIEDTQNTLDSDMEIINFKLRDQGGFGLKIISSEESSTNYSIVVYASSSEKSYLSSPFIKATTQDLAGTNLQTSNSSSSNIKDNETQVSNSNTLLYVLLLIAIVVIGLLLWKQFAKKRTIQFWIILLTLAPAMMLSQNVSDVKILTWSDINRLINDQRESNRANPTQRQTQRDLTNLELMASERNVASEFSRARYTRVTETINSLNNNLNNIHSNIKGNVDLYQSTKALYQSYKGLGNCINSVPLPGTPRMPSFCPDLNSDCGECFVDARRQLEETRYNLEKLKSIYSCTKKFSDAAISFGDNASGVHGISGLAWQSQRMKIMKSLENLDKAYDSKYSQYIESTHQALISLNECEAKYGMKDWYDRFGILFEDFIKMKYSR